MGKKNSNVKSSATNAARNLLSLISNEKVNVTGVWKTQELSNQFQKNQKWTFIFKFDVKDSTLLGTITLTPIPSSIALEFSEVSELAT